MGLRQMVLPGMPPGTEAEAVPFVPGSETSRAAATALRESGRAGTLAGVALKLFYLAGPWGLTDEQLDTAGRRDGHRFSTLRPRRVGLWRRGYVADSGRREDTSSGKRATVWVLTAAGEDAYVEGVG